MFPVVFRKKLGCLPVSGRLRAVWGLCGAWLVACTSGVDTPESSPSGSPTVVPSPTPVLCTDAGASPGQPERCDGLDNNCNGSVDEGVLLPFYPDLDGDGYGGQQSAPTMGSGIARGILISRSVRIG